MDAAQIILFEDDPIISWDLAERLKALNHHTTIADHQDSGVPKWTDSDTYDIIITNLKLSNGWIDQSFIDHINQCFYRVIILTGLNDKTLYDLSDLRVPHVMLYKPFTNLELKNCLSAINKVAR